MRRLDLAVLPNKFGLSVAVQCRPERCAPHESGVSNVRHSLAVGSRLGAGQIAVGALHSLPEIYGFHGGGRDAEGAKTRLYFAVSPAIPRSARIAHGDQRPTVRRGRSRSPSTGASSRYEVFVSDGNGTLG